MAQELRGHKCPDKIDKKHDMRGKPANLLVNRPGAVSELTNQILANRAKSATYELAPNLLCFRRSERCLEQTAKQARHKTR
jgi:hypothetical protein